MSTTAVKPKVGRPKSPLDLADSRELTRIAALASNVLISLRKPGRGMYESERELRRFLDEDGIAHSASDLSPALALLEACGKIGRATAKSNTPRPGWLITETDAASKRLLSVNGSIATTAADVAAEDAITPLAGPITPEPVEDVSAPPEPVTESIEITDEERSDALARAIIKAFKLGRGYQGNRALCESEAVLREWLTEDGVIFDKPDLAAALTKLETARLPGFETSRLRRGSALHRSYPITAKPLPARAMQLTTLHPMDSTTYEPADIEPYVI